jgi:chemotaxis-related protein WspD
MEESKPVDGLSKVSFLLERQIDPAYVAEWTQLLAKDRETSVSLTFQSLVVFRLGHEWLALPARSFSGITGMHTIRKVPHRSKDILEGLVNMQGQLSLCIDLAKFMDVARLPAPSAQSKQKMISIGEGQEKWVFVVDEILGLFPCDLGDFSHPPVNIEKSSTNYLKGLINIGDKCVSVLDEELLLYGLERRIA